MAKLDERAIFDAAQQIESAAARSRYLKEACEDDATLFARVEALLKIHDDPAFLGAPMASLVDLASSVGQEQGSQIGPYKLIEQIGEGGFGVVFLAEQKEPIRRLVALKILKPGMDTREVVARFEGERQALALMDHPNIARVFDAGATPLGRPYFVMELVKGVPITQYCQEQGLEARERLVLFAAVCRAAQHAHQKGVIHRDLKPTNVMVAAYDGRPTPKIIDFGVAKAVGERLTERTLVTGFASIIGTLEYMSPEQAEFNALDVDTRADVYSLGVLLYELLTGTTPLTRERLKQAAITEALRLIREEEPPKPSTRLSDSKNSLASVSAQRKLEIESLARELRGDLDWIVMNALEKDRDRRYQTANGLARDIERYLNDEPVEARPPSAAYKLGKFARKHRTGLSAACVFSLLLVFATAVSSWQAFRATVAEHNADLHRDRAEAEAKRAREHVFVAHMNLVQSDWEENRLERLVGLIEQHQPGPDQEDLRGFEWYYWRRLLDTALVTMKGHSRPETCVAYSPTGELLASASMDGTVATWDAATGRMLGNVQAHANMVRGVSFSPDGERLATASADGTVKVWNAASLENLATLSGHADWVTSVAYSADGKWLASGSRDRMVKLWDAASGQESRSWQAHQDWVTCVAFDSTGTRLATASKDKAVKIWDVSTGKVVRSLAGHMNEVQGVAFSPDAALLASADLSGNVRLWDVETGQPRRVVDRHADRAFCVTFAPDGRRLASASMDQTIKLWDVSSGQVVDTLKGHTAGVVGVAFSPDGLRLASASHDRTVKIWNPLLGQERMVTLQDFGRPAALTVAFSPDGTRLATAGVDSTLRIWDTASGQKTAMLNGHKGMVFSVRFSPDGTQLASASDDKTVKIWEIESGQELRTFTGDGEFSEVAFSPDGELLAAASSDATARVWEVASGGEKFVLRGHEKPVTSVTFGRDGRWLATGSDDQSVRIWRVDRGEQLRTFAGHSAEYPGITRVAFNREGSRLASAGRDHTVKIWDTASGDEVCTLRGHIDYVSSVVFSPDGKRVVSAGADTTIKLWDVATGQETLTLKKHGMLVTAIAFSDDGMRLASVGGDGAVLLWDARPWTSELRAQTESRILCRRLFDEVGLRSEVIERIQRTAGLEPRVSEAAARMAGLFQEEAKDLTIRSSRVVVRSRESPELYALALRQAQAAYLMSPDYLPGLRTLGMALYRCGQFKEAIDKLAACDRLFTAQNPNRNPMDVAFSAMAHFRLGQVAEAQELVNLIKPLLNRPAFRGLGERENFLREAVQLVEGE
ncbi:MAG TPA: serine/threonine-protein kinase [Pirellulales bacterium]|nr:serine/threonine-protein kinase [Pirellulales bacterium]